MDSSQGNLFTSLGIVVVKVIMSIIESYQLTLDEKANRLINERVIL